MSKLPANARFIDLSDYGRPIGRMLAKRLKNTPFTSVHVTLLFGVCGLAAVYFIENGQFACAGFFLILKSIIDAADGELSRIKNKPSYVGRYLDSVFDIVLNFLFLMSIGHVSGNSPLVIFIAFICLQLQGTLYNYYYVILRNNTANSDSTSKIFENKVPAAFPGESQKWVNFLFRLYSLFYGAFDSVIYLVDKGAHKAGAFPNWFMTFLSIYGLGFQLLIMAVMLGLNLAELIAPFFIGFSVFIFVLVWLRKRL